MIQLTSGQGVFVVKKYYETQSFIEVRVAFREILQQRIRDEFENLSRKPLMVKSVVGHMLRRL